MTRVKRTCTVVACFAECTRNTSQPILVFEEKGKVARFANGAREPLRRTQFDGCVDCVGRRADFVLRDVNDRTVIIELKGKAVADSVPQLKNTSVFVQNEHLVAGKPVALVVCAKVPLGVSEVQRITGELIRSGFGKVRIKSREWVGTFGSLF